MEYGVITEDGYILTLFRIPKGNDEDKRKEGKRPAVFM